MANDPNPNLTQLLNAAGSGDRLAASELIPLVYEQLRELARRRMAHEPAGHTLQPTALVNEAYLRLVADADAKWDNRRHFFAAASIAMRRILIERARAVGGPKRGGGRQRMVLEASDDHQANDTPPAEDTLDWLALDEALSALEKQDPALGEIVSLRYFAGLSVEATAALLGVSSRTVNRDWKLAKAWLYDFLSPGGASR